MISIADLATAGSGRLTRLTGEGGHRRRLLEMGFIPGTPIRLVRRVDVGGVLELELRGCRVTLRTAEAQQILVEPLD
ncbi:MAG: ferrous iron transport protein A [Planctomycetes bacterium]|nr:ferrous iron transport protein A [Planctomycetota bacterium]